MRLISLFLASLLFSVAAEAACPLGCCDRDGNYSFHRLTRPLCQSEHSHDELCRMVLDDQEAYACAKPSAPVDEESED